MAGPFAWIMKKLHFVRLGPKSRLGFQNSERWDSTELEGMLMDFGVLARSMGETDVEYALIGIPKKVTDDNGNEVEIRVGGFLGQISKLRRQNSDTLRSRIWQRLTGAPMFDWNNQVGSKTLVREENGRPIWERMPGERIEEYNEFGQFIREYDAPGPYKYTGAIFHQAYSMYVGLLRRRADQQKADQLQQMASLGREVVQPRAWGGAWRGGLPDGPIAQPGDGAAMPDVGSGRRFEEAGPAMQRIQSIIGDEATWGAFTPEEQAAIRGDYVDTVRSLLQGAREFMTEPPSTTYPPPHPPYTYGPNAPGNEPTTRYRRAPL